MAAEITVTSSLRVSKGSLNFFRNPAAISADLTGTKYDAHVQNIATTAAGVALSITVSAGGWAFFSNNDATNYVEIGVQVAGTFYPVLRLKPGESHPCRISVAALYARANTAAIDLEYFALEP